jgi:hypothetical protein
MTTADAAKAAGISHATLYRYAARELTRAALVLGPSSNPLISDLLIKSGFSGEAGQTWREPGL